MEFLGFCCGCPMVVVVAGGLFALWRTKNPVGRVGALCGGVLLLGLVGLVAYGEGRYVLLQEGIVLDACDGDTEGVRWRLNRGASPDARTDDGLGALECATTNGHVAVARLLLERGADPDMRNEALGGTPREDAQRDPEMRRLFARHFRREE